MADIPVLLGGRKFQEMSEALWAMSDGHMPKFGRGDLVETVAVSTGEVTPEVPGAGVIASGRWNTTFGEYHYRVRWPDDAETPRQLLDEYAEEELVLIRKGQVNEKS